MRVTDSASATKPWGLFYKHSTGIGTCTVSYDTLPVLYLQVLYGTMYDYLR